MLNTLFANDVRQTLEQFRGSVDRMFENLYGQTGQTQQPAASAEASEQTWTFSPVIESGWNDHYLSLRAVLPGVARNDVNVSVQNNQLIVQGERRAPEGFGKNPFMQLAYGRFYAALTLPSGLDLDRIHCHLHDGVLDIQVPLTETSKPRQIQIQTGDQTQAISA